MEPVTEREVRASFVNCSRGDAQRLNLPVDLAERPWGDLDFLAWADPRAPLQRALVTPTEGRGLVGILLRRSGGGVGLRRARMCSLCTTTHAGSGVSLMVAARAGRAGRDGNSVGLDMCDALECSLHARRLIASPTLSAAHETLPVEARVERLRRNVQAFVDRVVRA